MMPNSSLSKANSPDDLARVVVESTCREYPHLLHQQLTSDDDLLPPRALNPCFFGSYDWHSAVHSHWTLLRYLEAGCSKSLEREIVETINQHLTTQNVAQELAFFTGPSGLTSERPYGWAWLSLLEATCRDAGQRFAPALEWSYALRPLVDYLQEQLVQYFTSRLAFPIRAGTHSNTAFSLHICLQAAQLRSDAVVLDALSRATVRLFEAGRHLHWDDDISGDAFLTPSLTEAALLATVLPVDDFISLLERLGVPTPEAWRVPVFPFDGDDPATVHLEGLLISRAWGFEAIRRALPDEHPIGLQATEARDAHLHAITAIDPTSGFNRSHWLPTFLCYLESWLSGTWSSADPCQL